MSHLVETSVLMRPTWDGADATGRLRTSIVCVGELHAAVPMARSPTDRDEREARLRAVIRDFAVLAVDDDVASAYGRLRAETGRRPSNDLWIAATALAHDLVLVTRDEGLAGLSGVRTLLV